MPEPVPASLVLREVVDLLEDPCLHCSARLVGHQGLLLLPDLVSMQVFGDLEQVEPILLGPWSSLPALPAQPLAPLLSWSPRCSRNWREGSHLALRWLFVGARAQWCFGQGQISLDLAGQSSWGRERIPMNK